MNFFFDTEFIDNGDYIGLVSIGIVPEFLLDAEPFYAVSNEFNAQFAKDWHWQHVFPNLGIGDEYDLGKDPTKIIQRESMYSIKQRLIRWLQQFPQKEKELEFHAYYASYDWFLFCRIFGTMLDLPKNVLPYCHDLKHMADKINLPREKYPIERKGAHNALQDAFWNRELFKIIEIEEQAQWEKTRCVHGEFE